MSPFYFTAEIRSPVRYPSLLRQADSCKNGERRADVTFVERRYKMLLVSSGEHFIREIDALLRGSLYQTDNSSTASDARCKLHETHYDIVIVNAPLSDEFGSRLCIDATRNNSTIAGLFTANDAFEEIYAKTSVQGVFVIHKPTSRTLVSQALSLMICARERLRMVEKKAVKAESKLDELRIVNKAKWMLIDNEGFSEAEAHRYVEKSAMDAGITKRLAAQIIIDSYLN